jgi:hypothetical protein
MLRNMFSSVFFALNFKIMLDFQKYVNIPPPKGMTAYKFYWLAVNEKAVDRQLLFVGPAGHDPATP